MKNTITFLMCTLCIITGIAQSDLSGNELVIPERTPALEALYLQARDLEENGTAVQINANRLAIKNAWQTIDPNVAALYKPITAEQSINLGGDEPYIPTIIKERPESPENWGIDKLLKNGWIDGVDMDVTGSGDIYIGAYENLIDFGGTNDSIYVYRSTNDGNSFQKWKSVATTVPILKIQTITIDGSGDNFLSVYLITKSGKFQVARWNMATGTYNAQTIATDVVDFSVDRNYPNNTSSQRVFATYHKSNHSTYSARSTAGSYGFDWVDETSFSLLGDQVTFAYGRDGSCYTAFIGYNTRSLRAIANSNSNDPASWGTKETLTDGGLVEIINPSIRATRHPIANDWVMIFVSTRLAGSTDNYQGKYYRRTNSGNYVQGYYFIFDPEYNYAHQDSWIRRINDTKDLQSACVSDRIDNTENDRSASITDYGGYTASYYVSDPEIDAFDGFPPAVAETRDGLPCLAFAGTQSGYGWGLYWDAKSTLKIEDNNFEKFKFYPNPTQDIINLSANNTIESVSIFSILGQKVMDVSVNENTSSINIESLTQGVYLMKVIIDGKSATYKIIKQ